MKRVISIISIIFYFYSFQYFIYINYKFSNSTLNNKTKRIRNFKIQSLVFDEKFNSKSIELKQFSGQYEEISSTETINNNNNKYNIENIYFLLTTNTKRFRQTINFIKFWSKFANIKCLIVFEEKDYSTTTDFKEYLLSNEIPCQIKTSNTTRYEVRVFQLIEFGWNFINKSNQSQNLEWFAIGDDDTIWFIENLLKTLEQYNSSKLIYLGNISDRTESIQRHGDYYAYGGGGILLTKPLVQLISKYSQQCENEFFNMYGSDEIIGKCITKLLKINLTVNKHFHQIDHQGDIQGFLQSGIQGLVSLHHMFSWWKPFPPQHSKYENETINIIQIAYQTFRSDFLRRFFKINFKTNQTFLFTCGYSFTLFNRILSKQELNQVELTWCCSQLYQTKTRPKENNKINWFFKQITSQYYNGQIINGSIYQNNEEQILITFND